MERLAIVKIEKKVKEDIERILAIEAEKEEKQNNIDAVRILDLERGRGLKEE